MALTIAADTAGYNTPYSDVVQLGPYRLVPVKITFDSSYPTGGESVRVSGSPVPERAKILGFFPHAVEDATSAANIFYYIPSSEKIMAVVGTAGANAQVSNATDLSSVIVYGVFLIWGQ